MRSALLYYVFISFLILLAGCRNEEPVKIGFMGSLTGRLAEVGRATRDGCLLAIESANQANGPGGRRFELITYDDQHDAAKAVAGIRYLHNQGVVAVVGPITSQMSISATPEANRLKLPLLSPTSSSSELTNLQDFFFRTYPTSNKSAQALADYAVRQVKLKRLAIIYDTSNRSFTIPWKDTFTERATELSAEVILTKGYNTKSPQDSFLDMAQEVAAARPDGLLILANPLDTGLICQQFRKLGSEIALLGSDWSYAGALTQYGGQAVEGFIFPTCIDMNNRAKAFLNFQKEYTERFGATPTFPAIHAYETTEFLIKALKQTNDNREQLPEKLVRLDNFSGLQDEFQMNAFGDVERKIYINRIHNGEFTNLEHL